MKYAVSVNKRYQYVKVYNVVKKVNESTNKVSKAASRFMDRLLFKKKGAEPE